MHLGCQFRAQALLLSVRRSVYFYMILKVGKWGVLSYILAWPDVTVKFRSLIMEYHTLELL